MDRSVYIKDSIIFEKYKLIKNLIIVLEGTIVDVNSLNQFFFINES